MIKTKIKSLRSLLTSGIQLSSGLAVKQWQSDFKNMKRQKS